MVDDVTGTVDMMTALLAAWNEEEVELMGTEVLPALLREVRPQYPGEMETLFADQVTLPGLLFDDTWTDLHTVADLLARYAKRLTPEERRQPRALAGVRCLVVLLFCFDTRMREFMWAQHGVHEILGTHDFDSNARVRRAACLIMDPLFEYARVFVANVLLAREYNDVAAIVQQTKDLLDYTLRFWTTQTDGLPWSSEKK